MFETFSMFSLILEEKQGKVLSKIQVFSFRLKNRTQVSFVLVSVK